MADDSGDPRDRVMEGEVMMREEGAFPALVVDQNMIGGLTRAEIDISIATAHKFPRAISAVKRQIETLATLDTETAMSCFFRKPVGKKKNKETGAWEQDYIEGPSIRFAEIVLASYGNARVASRRTDLTDTDVEATGIFHDLESNVAWAKSVRMGITTSEKDGQKAKRFSNDLINTISNAAASKALRNAILAGVAKGYWNPGYQKARAAAMGDIKTLGERREAMFAAFGEQKVTPAQVLEVLGVRGADDITLDKMFDGAGILNALKDGETSLAELLGEARAGRDAPSLDAAFGQAKPAAARATRAQAAKAEPIVDTKVNTETHDPKTGEVTETVDPQQQAAAQSAEPDRTTKESATGASGASAAATSSPGEQDKPLGVGAVIDPGVKVSEGYPAPKEIYHLAGDLGWLASDGKWKTFQDGEPFSRAAGRAGLKVYVEHAPKAAISDGGERIDDAQREADEDGFPGDQAPTQTKGPGYDVDALNAYAAAVRKLTLGVDVARYVAMFRTSDAFKKAPPEIQRQALTLAYNHTVEIDPDCQPATNPALFRLWLVQCEAHQARDMFSRLIRSKEYDGLSDAEKDEIADEVEAIAGE